MVHVERDPWRGCKDGRGCRGCRARQHAAPAAWNLTGGVSGSSTHLEEEVELWIDVVRLLGMMKRGGLPWALNSPWLTASEWKSCREWCSWQWIFLFYLSIKIPRHVQRHPSLLKILCSVFSESIACRNDLCGSKPINFTGNIHTKIYFQFVKDLTIITWSSCCHGNKQRIMREGNTQATTMAEWSSPSVLTLVCRLPLSRTTWNEAWSQLLGRERSFLIASYRRILQWISMVNSI